MTNEIITIKENCESKIEVKKSVFIAHLIRVNSEDDAKLKLDEIRKEYKDATHNVPAYRVLDTEKNMIIEKASDDGEPQGTSGMPILNLLQHKNMLNVLLVVTRYFGGTLLGTGGLVKAYTDSAKQVIENSELVTLNLLKHYSVKSNYDSFNKLKKRLEDNKFIIENINYNIDISFDLYIKDNDNEQNILNKIIKEYDNEIIINELDKIFK